MKKFNQFSTKTIPVLELKYGIDRLAPTMSRQTVDVHYNILTKNYSKKFAETGDQFQENGIRLHNLWWANLTDKRVDPSPFFVDWVSKKFDSWNGFLGEISSMAKTLQGNGWIVLRETGNNPILELIHNHDYPRPKIDTILGIWDLWEHAFIYDYPGQRDVYVQKLMKITDWRVIENRLVNK
jgi:superoxide dismutase